MIQAPIPQDDISAGRRLWQVCLLFLKLGAIGFGGPAAIIAMMEDEVVNRQGERI